MKYNHKQIEQKWQGVWEKEGIYRAEFPSKKKKYYVLIEFPYPSGERLHVGHARSYSAMDAIARKRRMQGYNVLYPIGWDAFGLPAENYAIKTGIHPSITTKKNIENAKKQAKNWGLSFDWSREINTTDPKYYKWTQWIFLQLFKQRLAYRAEIPVNWCPSCKINLANEEVIDGKCERCGAQTGRRMQKQWMLKITAYAERLLKDLETVNYRKDIKQQQINWIGRKEGIDITYPIEGSDKTVTTFTTRPDTNFGATFIVLAPEKMLNGKHLAEEIATKEQLQKVKKYIKGAQKKSELERIIEGKKKTGVFTGRYAINQLNGYKMPIWVSDFVLAHVGTGALVGVPGHDKRDFEFAQTFGLPIIRVVVGKDGDRSPITKVEQVQEEEGNMVNSDFLNGMDIHEATKKMMDYLEEKGWGKRTVMYNLRDWVFSRQHYWGEPIPIIYCRRCWEVQSSKFKVQSKEGIDFTEIGEEKWAIVAVSGNDLPIELPYVKKYEPTETGESPLANVEEWVKIKCPKCGGEARRETDTMPNWAGSSWYFLAYAFGDELGKHENTKARKHGSTKARKHGSTEAQKHESNNTNIFEDYKNELGYWLPVDWYNGGLEHTTLHLLYSRFWHKFLFDLSVVPTPEPYAKRTSHGVVLGPDGAKMSKSRGNVINPDEVIERYGADSFRVYEMFMGPFEEQVAWSDEALNGVRRFLDRVWRLYTEKWEVGDGKWETEVRSEIDDNEIKASDRQSISHQSAKGANPTSHIPHPTSLRKSLHKTVKKVTEDMEKLKFNTAIAALMEFINEVYKFQLKAQGSGLEVGDREVFLRLLAPFAPHLAEELWQGMRSGKWEVGIEKEDRTSHLSPQSAEGTHPTSHISHPTSQNIFVSIHTQPWPQYDPALIEDKMIEFVIQVNGKLRATLVVESRMSNVEGEMQKKAKESKRVKKYIEGKKIKKTIFVPGKLINFVV